LRPALSRRFWIGMLLLLLLVAGLVYAVWYLGVRQVVPYYSDPEEHYKYGTIGNEADGGIPYWVWVVLPRVFSKYLPGDGGLASLGMVWEEPRESDGQWLPGGGPPPVGGKASYSVPVGFSVRRVGIVPMVAMNCALCHTSAVRRPGDVAPMLFFGGPSHQIEPLSYIRFLSQCAHDPEFNADRLLAEIEYNVKLSPVEKLLYRTVIIPQTKSGLLDLEKQYSWTTSRPDWGRGRIDPFNPIKFGLLGMSPDGDTTIGNADMPPIWNLQPREGMALHWDGLNDSIHEVVLSSALGDGARPKTIPLDMLDRVEKYLRAKPPPKFSDVFGDRAPIKADLARAGEAVYKREKCDVCHDFGGKRTGTIIPVEEVGTDIERHKLWGDEAASRYNAYAEGYPWKFSHFRGTNGPGGGYASVPLDGVWIRAPFLHNGSVPTLRDLLEPPSARPKVFYRGNDLYDPARGGFVSDQPTDGWRRFRKYDTNVPANGNGGHLYGTDLKTEDKDALVEYLKTL
jgi:hypothetical protein